MKSILFVLIPATLLFACTKSKSDSCPLTLRLTPNDSTPVVGDTVVIYANRLGMLYSWWGPGLSDPNDGSGNSVTIAPIALYQTGWYYCTASETGCNAITDSVYIDVQFAQGSPACNVTDDLITNTAGVPDFSGGNVIETVSGGYNSVMVTASGGALGPEFDFVFNPANGTSEPRDGIYYTTSDPTFSGQDANAITMIVNYFPYYFESEDGARVYVSHVNGKLRVAFCSVKLDDYSGINGLFSGQVTVQ